MANLLLRRSLFTPAALQRTWEAQPGTRVFCEALLFRFTEAAARLWRAVGLRVAVCGGYFSHRSSVTASLRPGDFWRRCGNRRGWGSKGDFECLGHVFYPYELQHRANAFGDILEIAAISSRQDYSLDAGSGGGNRLLLYAAYR
jgi:hypothetical protein